MCGKIRITSGVMQHSQLDLLNTRKGEKMIKLWPNRAYGDRSFTEGDYAGDPNGTDWVWTRYTDSLCSGRCEDDHCYLIHPSECRECGKYIQEMDHFLCVDGGDSAHSDCVEAHADYPHQVNSLYDCPACEMDDREESYA